MRKKFLQTGKRGIAWALSVSMLLSSASFVSPVLAQEESLLLAEQAELQEDELDANNLSADDLIIDAEQSESDETGTGGSGIGGGLQLTVESIESLETPDEESGDSKSTAAVSDNSGTEDKDESEEDAGFSIEDSAEDSTEDGALLSDFEEADAKTEGISDGDETESTDNSQDDKDLIIEEIYEEESEWESLFEIEEEAMLAESMMLLAAAPAGSLQAQINDANDGDTITLTQNVIETLVIPDRVNVTLDLGGYVLSPDTSTYEGSSDISAISVYGNLTIKNGEIKNSKEASGVRGVAVARGGSFTMEEGVSVSGFSTSSNGGGVLVQNGGSFTMNGGVIENNAAEVNGGGILVQNGGSFTMNGGAVENNSTGVNGGGIFAYDGSSIHLNGGTVRKNSAVNGGGLYVYSLSSGAVLTFGETVISENKASGSGGGIYTNCSGQIEITGAKVLNNTAQTAGGGIYFAAGSTVTISGGTINGNTASDAGGGIYLASSSTAKSTLTIGNAEVNQNIIASTNATSRGAGIIAGASSYVNLKGSTSVSKNTGARLGGGVYLDSSSSLLMEGQASISNNILESVTSDSCSGGGICTTNYPGSITLRGESRIEGNRIPQTGTGGGIYADQYLTITMEDNAAICNNEVNGGAGGIRIYWNSKIVMKDNSSISNNKAASSGAIELNAGVLEMSGNAAITQNKVTGNNGGVSCSLTGTYGQKKITLTDTAHIEGNTAGGNIGGVSCRELTVSGNAYIKDNSAKGYGGGAYIYTLELRDAASISGNTAGTYGGGISATTANLSGNARISGNTAGTYGGGINATAVNLAQTESGETGVILEGNTAGTYGGAIAATTVVMDGGTIRNNSAASNGGGLYINKDGSLTLSADIVYENTAQVGLDVYLSSNTAANLAKPDTLSGKDENDNEITGAGWLEDQSGAYTREAIVHSEETDAFGYTLLLTDREYVAKIGDLLYPTVQAAAEAAVEMQEEGPSDPVLIEMIDNSWEAVTILEGTSVILDLAGYVLHGAGSSVITVPKTASLTLRDSSEAQSGKITGGTGQSVDGSLIRGGGLYVAGKFTLEGGTITGNRATVGAGIYLTGEAVLLGGSIENNTGVAAGSANPSDTTVSTGGGIALYGMLRMPKESVTVIRNNTARDGGGVIASGTNGDAQFEMAGGWITGNSASNIGGGAFIYNGAKFTLSGGEISSNKFTGTANGGGGVANANGTFTMTGGTITGNSSTRFGGGVFVNGSTGTAQILGGNITENTATNGGGISLYEQSTATIKGGNIEKNRVTGYGGGIYLFQNSKIEILGGRIKENEAGGYGGGVYTSTLNNQLYMDDGVITGNRSVNEGGGVYCGVTAEITGGDIFDNQGDTANDIYTVNSTIFTLTGVNNQEGKEYSYWYDSYDGSYIDRETGVPTGKIGHTCYLTAVKSRPNSKSVARIGDVYYDTLQAAFDAVPEKAQDGEDEEEITVHLTADVCENTNVPAGKSVILNLNGYTLTNAVQGTNTVTVRGNLTLADEKDVVKQDYKTGSDGGVITLNEDASMGRGIYVVKEASFTMTGGTIKGFKGMRTGGAIQKLAGGTLTISGGTLTDNQATVGGAIAVTTANSTVDTTVSISGGEIINNEATNGGAIYISLSQGTSALNINGGSMTNNEVTGDGGAICILGNPVLTITEGKINNNSGVRGGAVYSQSLSAVILKGGEISGNKATTGGGIYGKVTMNGGKISDNITTGGGGGIYGTTTIENGEISGNTATTGGGIYGTVNMSGGRISGNTATGTGGGIFGNVTMTGGEISGNTAANGGGIGSSVHAAAFNLNGGVIANNTAHTNGGGVYTYDENKLNLKGVKITGNHAETGSGGGIYRYQYGGGEFQMDGDTEITNNTAATNGGGIYAGWHLTINKGKISGNKASGGGGIYSWMQDITIKNGEISNNSAVTGGAISGYSFGVIMEGGQVCNNTATGAGGAFHLYGEHGGLHKSLLSGGTITGNKAANGGAISCERGVELEMTGTACTGNTASNKGGGIFIDFYINKVILSDKGLLYGNKANVGNDIFVNYTTNSQKTLSLLLRNPVEMMSDIEGYTGAGWYDEYRDTITTDKIHYDPVLKVYPLTLVYHTEEPVAFIGKQGYSTLQAAVDAVLGGSYPKTEDDVPVIHMVTDIEENVEIPEGVKAVLNLNGYTLKGISTALTCLGELTIRDVKTTVTDEAGKNYSPGEETGTITGHAYNNGGGIIVPYGGTVTMESGQISGCQVINTTGNRIYGGAGVYIDGGTFTLTGTAAIRDCSAVFGAAVMVNSGTSQFLMSGESVIEDNTTTYDGTVYVYDGTIRMSGGTIQNNKASDNSGGIHMTGTSSAKAILSGGAILNNTAQNSGGAIYQGSGELQLSNIEIRGNRVLGTTGAYSTNSGGAVFQYSGTMLIQEGTVITGNSARWGGAIAQYNTSSVKMLGGSITGNRAQYGGGLAQYAETASSFVLIDGLLAGNTATISGEGNDIYSRYTGTLNYEMQVASANKPRVTLPAAADMNSSAYNVWRDDTYDADPIVREAEIIGKGQHVTGHINEANNLMLTAAYYGDTGKSEGSTDLAVQNMVIQANNSGTDGAKDGTAAFDEEKKSIEKTALEMLEAEEEGWSYSDKVYYYNDPAKKHALNLITYDGDDYRKGTYEQDQAAIWSPGDDSGEKNNIIRTYDKIYYTLSADLQRPKNPEDTGDEQGGGTADGSDTAGGDAEDTKGEQKKYKVWFEAEFPCSSDELTLDATSLKQYYSYTNEENHFTVKGYIEKEMADSETGTFDVTISAKVQAMKNGDLIKPVFRAWVEGNKENEENPAVCEGKTLTVSAAPRYNIVLMKNPELAYTGYFDLSTGQEASEAEMKGDPVNGIEPNPNVIYGTMLGYGITLELMNDKTGKKDLKGIELPEGDLVFDLRQDASLYLDGEPILDENKNQVTVAPYLWAYKANSSTDYGIGANGGSFNMNWNDEDDLSKTTNYAYGAAPYNSGMASNACYAGGVWSAAGNRNEDTSTLTTHFKISNYAIRTNVTKASQTSGTSISNSPFNASHVWAFSAGYLQVICPIDETLSTGDGYMQISMQSVVSDLQAVGASGQEPQSGTGGLDIMKEYFGDDSYPDGKYQEGAYREHAVREMNYEDNYLRESSGLYIFSGAGNGDRIEKNNYFRKTDRTVLVSDAGTGSTPLGSQAYISADVQFYSKEYRTDDPEDKAHYIAPEDFDAQKDNVLEYNYMTAMNLLQKFDADGFTPLECGKIDQRFDLSTQTNVFGGSGNNVFSISTTDTATTWSSSKPIQTMSYDLKILYAAKPDGSNWTKKTLTDADGKTLLDEFGREEDDGGVADMDSYRMDSTDNQLLYFETLQELYDYFGKDGDGNYVGKCVGILYQFRNCCLRTGRKFTVSSRMQMNSDFENTGKTYCTTNDVQCWSTYRPAYKEARSGGTLKDNIHTATVTQVTNDNGTYYVYDSGADEDGETQAKDTISAQRYWDEYVKTRYEDGFQAAGTHTGWLRGNTLLLYTLDSTISIVNTDLKENSNAVKETYLVSNGERTANFKVAPALGFSSGVSNLELVSNGTKSTDVEIVLHLPKHLNYNEGSVAFDYTGSGYTADNMSWTVEYMQNEDGTSELILKTKVSDITKALPVFTYNCTIGTPGAASEYDVPSGADLVTVAEIKSSYDEVNNITGQSHRDSVTVTAIRTVEDAISKSVEEPLVELGEDMVYDLVYTNRNEQLISVELCDILPYNGDGRGTSFHGGYRLKALEVYFASEDDLTVFQESDNGGVLKYTQGTPVEIPWGTESASAVEKTVMDSFANAKSVGVAPVQGTTADADGNKQYMLTYDLGSEGITPQLSTGDVTAIYLKVPQASKGDLRVRVILSPMQMEENEQTGKNELITDEKKSVQTGGDIYWNNFFYRSGSVDLLVTSGSCSVKTIERTLSGVAWMDQDRDGVYSTVTTDTDKPIRNMNVYLCAAEGESDELCALDKTGAKIQIAEIGRTKYYQVNDILGNAVSPAVTDTSGAYMFTNLQAGTYYVLFQDSDGKYSAYNAGTKKWETPLAFGRLSVTPVRDSQTVYATSTAATDKALPFYGENGTYTDTNTSPAELGWAVISNAGSGITLPAKENMTIAHYVTANWNAGFYYTDLTVQKVWKNLYAVPDTGTSVEFTVTGTVKPKENDSTAENRKTWTNTITLTQGTSGVTAEPSLSGTAALTVANSITAAHTLTWTLSHMALQAEGSSGVIDWSVQEAEAKDSNGQLLKGYVKTSSLTDTGTAITFNAYNTRILYTLDITKVGRSSGAEETHPLADAAYTLYTDSGCTAGMEVKQPGTSNNFVLTSNSEGKMSFASLPAGTYYLKETKTPAGYQINKAVYKIVISYEDTGSTGGTDNTDDAGSTAPNLTTPTITATQITDSKTGDALAQDAILSVGATVTSSLPPEGDVTGNTTVPVNYQISFTVEDECIYELPQTGGAGIWWNTLAGVALMLAALWLMDKRKNKLRSFEA